MHPTTNMIIEATTKNGNSTSDGSGDEVGVDDGSIVGVGFGEV